MVLNIVKETEEKKEIEIPKKEKPKRLPVRPRAFPVSPTDIVDVWRLYERSIEKQIYPDLTEDPKEAIRAHLFQYMQSPLFGGMIAKVGKRPVGMILGHVVLRPFGRPSRYACISLVWVDPQFRKQGIGKLLWGGYSAKMKNAGVFHWESDIYEEIPWMMDKKIGTKLGGRL